MTATAELIREAAPERRPRATLWTLRVVSTLHALSVVLQPILIGSYLNGNYDALAVHSVNALAVTGLATVVLATALAYVVWGRGPFWVVPAAITLFLVEGTQIGMGYARQMQLHVPFGVLIVAAALALCAWSWTGRAAQPRRRRA